MNVCMKDFIVYNTQYICVEINESNINTYFLLMHNYKVHKIYNPILLLIPGH